MRPLEAHKRASMSVIASQRRSSRMHSGEDRAQSNEKYNAGNEWICSITSNEPKSDTPNSFEVIE